MAWILLVIAGLLEVAWVIGLKYTEGYISLLAAAKGDMARIEGLLEGGASTRRPGPCCAGVPTPTPSTTIATTSSPSPPCATTPR